MSFKKWFADYLEITGLHWFYGDCMKAAYEAGQRDMRERASAICSENAMDTNSMRESILCDDLAKAIRAIKLESEL